MNDLTLLGRWSETPLETWPGFCEEAIAQFRRLSGVTLVPFSFNRKGLHEQYYLRSSTDSVFEWYAGKDYSARQRLSDALIEQYYRDASRLESFTKMVEGTNLTRLSNAQLQALLRDWMVLPGRLAAPIFFTLLLDMRFADESRMLDILQAAAEMRDDCTKVYDLRAKPQMSRVYEEYAHRLHMEPEAIWWLFPDELQNAIEGAPIAVSEQLKSRIVERREQFVATYLNNRYVLLSGAEASAALSQVNIPAEGTRRKHLQGRGVVGGPVRGRARVVLQQPDFAEFKDGETLVCYQTSITYEPLFNRASAVLTELGGLTSHAAVICAERGIPCIIGIHDLIASVNNGAPLAIDPSLGTVEVLGNTGELP